MVSDLFAQGHWSQVGPSLTAGLQATSILGPLLSAEPWCVSAFCRLYIVCEGKWAASMTVGW